MAAFVVSRTGSFNAIFFRNFRSVWFPIKYSTNINQPPGDDSTVTSKTVDEQHQQGDEQKQQTDENEYEQSVRNNILSASLPFVLELGWSKAAISAGAQTIGYPGVVHGLFPRGGAELVQYFYTDSNQKLLKILKEDAEKGTAAKEATEIITNAIEIRLRMVVPYLPKWPQALAIMALPPNVPYSLANLLTLADDICYYAGDRSVDFMWYGRRIGIAGIYKTTELFMIQDKSPDHAKTWQFLQHRIIEAAAINSVLKQSENAGQNAKEAISSAFIIARNILGINFNR